MKEFIIPFFGLKQGKHEFKFKIDQAFFEAFESTLLEKPRIDVVLDLEILSNMLIMEFKATGVTVEPCDRCGEDFDLAIEAQEKVFVKFGDETYDQTDEIIIVSHDTHEIDVSHRIYEMLVLCMPNKRVHPSIEDCNTEVTSQLENFEDDIDDTVDPRWDALKKLK
jgi:uncharacterized metal-binding protein YceD (DUF177 family)